MEASSLDFSQLLQRDLDDHRVAVNLIPYLLRPEVASPAFFPPIVAVLLPFHNNRPSYFPTLAEPSIETIDNAQWRLQRAESAFQVERLLTQNGEPHPESLARLRWNQSDARLVVLDGQHRAMALLAIERTHTNSWQTTTGARFRSFYEAQVKRELRRHGGDFDLGAIEVPVAVCWFPEKTGADQEPHRAARKLFVDVNKEAKPPSESRIILLSDSELVNVLTRSMLGELRESQNHNAEYLPLYAVEYDNPEVNSSRPARWSVMTNIHLLKMAVDRCIFGPPKYLQNIKLKIMGRPSPPERDAFMREQLNIAELFGAEVEDGGFTYQRDSIGDREFPLGQSSVISSQFTQTWGRAMLTLLSRTAPYSAHADALTKFKNDWHVDDTFMSLAHDALFSGVGVYWTLRDSYDHYLAEQGKGAARQQSKSDVVRAWELLKKRESDFEVYRANAYLESGKRDTVQVSKNAYTVFNTHACQLGLIMTMGTLWELRKRQVAKVDLADLPSFAEAMVEGLNIFFAKDNGKVKDRRQVLIKKDIKNPVNQIANMDTPQAVYFRFFWLQMLAVPEAWEAIASWIPDRNGFDNILGQARELYLELCTDQRFKALKTSRPGTEEAKLRSEAEAAASKSLKRALRDWFDLPEDSYEFWYREERGKSKGSTTVAEQAEGDAGEDVEDAGGDNSHAPATKLADLLDEE
ncbi:hypothetical protein LUW74_37710 [Actinomadura madurae]|nr:DNA sulfur modification protein DndB [Actinomadura madurae]URN10787.1 hypothetical protein LUW74_37710 [Actinomadura madurae]